MSESPDVQCRMFGGATGYMKENSRAPSCTALLRRERKRGGRQTVIVSNSLADWAEKPTRGLPAKRRVRYDTIAFPASDQMQIRMDGFLYERGMRHFPPRVMFTQVPSMVPVEHRVKRSSSIPQKLGFVMPP